MKKFLILSFLLIINCNIGSESSEDTEVSNEVQKSEEVSSSKTLEYPSDFDIYELFECLSDNNIGQIPEPKFLDNSIIIEFDDGYSAEYIENFTSASSSCVSEFKNSNDGNSENDVIDSSSKSNIEINIENECKKGFYSQRPNPVKEDDSFLYMSFIGKEAKKFVTTFMNLKLLMMNGKSELKT